MAKCSPTITHQMEFNTRNGQFSYLSYDTHSSSIPHRCSYNSSFLLSLSTSHYYFLSSSENENVLEILKGITSDVRHHKIMLRSLILELEGAL